MAIGSSQDIHDSERGYAMGNARAMERFYVNGTRMSSWCAGDAIFVPAVLGRTANV